MEPKLIDVAQLKPISLVEKIGSVEGLSSLRVITLGCESGECDSGGCIGSCVAGCYSGCHCHD